MLALAQAEYNTVRRGPHPGVGIVVVEVAVAHRTRCGIGSGAPNGELLCGLANAGFKYPNVCYSSFLAT